MTVVGRRLFGANGGAVPTLVPMHHELVASEKDAESLFRCRERHVRFDGNLHQILRRIVRRDPPISTSLSVLNWVAALAPKRQVVSLGTSLPQISRPRLAGRP